jgi:hypothetical protein
VLRTSVPLIGALGVVAYQRRRKIMSRQDLQTAMEATNAMIRDDSHLLLDKYGERLRDAVNKGEITHTVDRGRARLLLANVPSLELLLCSYQPANVVGCFLRCCHDSATGGL